MINYGKSDLESFAEALRDEVVSTDRDWSVDAAYHLAMALLAVEKLEEKDVDITFRNRPLLVPHLREAWRELMYLRNKRLSEEIKFNDIKRRVSFSLASVGEIKIDKAKNRSLPRQEGDSLGRSETKTERVVRRLPKYKRRIYRRDRKRKNQRDNKPNTEERTGD